MSLLMVWLILINSKAKESLLPKPVRGQLSVVPKYVSVLASSAVLFAALSAYRIAMALPGTADLIVIGSVVFLCLLNYAASPIVNRLAIDFRSRYGFALF
ncbi:MAG: hypothetical protein O3C21_09080 [Verrucomicrobia bacterium]|nr:hypothetical protein [Verrucomicrobiota bacterium]